MLYNEMNNKLKGIIEEGWEFKIATKIRRYWHIHIWKKGYFQYKRIFSVHHTEEYEDTKKTIEHVTSAIEKDIKRDIEVLENLAEISTRW